MSKNDRTNIELMSGYLDRIGAGKILVNREGKIEDIFASFTKPMSKKITKAIEKIL